MHSQLSMQVFLGEKGNYVSTHFVAHTPVKWSTSPAISTIQGIVNISIQESNFKPFNALSKLRHLSLAHDKYRHGYPLIKSANDPFFKP